MGALVPTRHQACEIGGDVRRVGRALDDLAPVGCADRVGSELRVRVAHARSFERSG